MSLVGPRPPLRCAVEHYDIWHRRRLSMKPGMTSRWQIGARREREFDGWSLWLDVRGSTQTVPAMLSGTDQ